MSDKRISELTSAGSVSGSDVVPIVQSSTTKRTTLQVIADWIIQTAASFTPSGSGAIAEPVQSVLRWLGLVTGYLSEADRAALRAGTSVDIATAVANALAEHGTVWLPANTSYTLGSKVTVPANKTVRGFDKDRTKVTKAFNGDMFEVGSRGGLHGFQIAGAGASFTGRGVIVTEGTNGNNGGRQNFSELSITDMASYCAEYTADGVGYASKWVNCDFGVTGNDIYCVKLPTDTSTGNRSFVGCSSPSDSLVNMSGAANTIVNGCFSGRSSSGNLHCIGMSSATVGAIISGNRLAGGGQTFTVNGSNGSITGNVIAGNVTFAATLITTKYSGNDSGSGTITDNAPGAAQNNEIYYKRQIAVPTWTASGGATSIGAGSLSVAYSRNGEWCQFDLNLNGGADTNWASGFYTFTLPFTASRDATAAVLMNDSDTNFYCGSAKIIGGSANMRILSADTTNAFVGAAIPFTWATSDKLHVTGAFLIQ